jgi:hypothetical protein
MKKLFVLPMLISLGMVCSCQKQSATAEQQLAQRKAELDAREKALDEREKALTKRENAVAHARTLAAELQSRALKKDSSGNLAPAPSIPPGLAPAAPDSAQLKADREKRIQDRLAQRQRRLEALQKMRSLAAQASSPDEASAGAGATSPSPSPTPQ